MNRKVKIFRFIFTHTTSFWLKIRHNRKRAIILISIFISILIYYLNEAYIKEVVNLAFADLNYIPAREQFMMYRCEAQVDKNRNCGGLGDRIKGIVSAYLWAIITNRTFLIRIDRPCEFDQLYEPNMIDWNGRRNETFDSYDTIEIEADSAFKNRFSRLNFTLLYQKKKLIILNSNRNLAQSISKTVHSNIREKVKKLGFNPDKLDMPYTFKYIYNYLFKLTPHLNSKYKSFLARAKPNNDTKLICAQIRIGKHQHFYKANYIDVYAQSEENAKRYWKIIRENFIANISNQNYKIFITTDSEFVHTEAIREFGMDKIVFNEGPFNHVDFLENTQDNCFSVEKSILDFHSLQNCDMAVISRSQFGRFGLWNRDNPLKEVYEYNEFDTFSKWYAYDDLRAI